MPTALSLSVLDIKEPGDYEDNIKLVYAASRLGKPITLISFLAVNQCISDDKDIASLL